MAAKRVSVRRDELVLTGDVTDWYKVTGTLKRAVGELSRIGPASSLQVKMTAVAGGRGLVAVEWSVLPYLEGERPRADVLEDRAARAMRQAEQEAEAEAKARLRKEATGTLLSVQEQEALRRTHRQEAEARARRAAEERSGA